jgi:hypothetical protein
MPTFAEYLAETLAPGWLQDERGAAFLRAFGAAQDAEVALLKEAVKARMPGLCPSDALALLALERGIEHGAAEDEASFRARVKGAWDVWRWAGTPYGLLLAFYWAGFRPTSGKVVLQAQKGWQYELPADFDPAVHTARDVVITNIGTVHLGGAPELWSQFALLFVTPILPAWVPTLPADGSLEVDAIRQLIRKWKPGHARCVALKVVGGRLWGYPPDDLFSTYSPQTWLQVGSGLNATWTPPAG